MYSFHTLAPGEAFIGPKRPILAFIKLSITYPVLYRVSAKCESQITKNRGACALTRAGGIFYNIKLKSACRKPDLSLSGLDPVPLSKMRSYCAGQMRSIKQLF